MARWATVCVVGGVTFTGCRVEMVDAEPFLSTRTGSTDWANDGTVYIQAVDRSTRGIQFGLNMVSAEGTKIQDVINAVNTAAGTQDGIEIEVTDGIISIDVIATADYTKESWFHLGQQSEGWYTNVSFRFISQGNAP